MPLQLSFAQITTVTLALFLAVPAQAITLNRSQGNWQSFTGGNQIDTFTILGENQVRWGIPIVANPTILDQSGLGFTGVGASSIAVGSSFQLGRLRHFNNAVFAGTSVSAAELSIALDFVEFGVTTFDFTLNIDETLNVEPCIYASATPCADRISWASATPAQTFFSGGIEYTLQLTGFSNFSGGSTLSQFISQEGGTSETFLFGQLTALTPPPPPTPPTPPVTSPTPPAPPVTPPAPPVTPPTPPIPPVTPPTPPIPPVTPPTPPTPPVTPPTPPAPPVTPPTPPAPPVTPPAPPVTPPAPQEVPEASPRTISSLAMIGGFGMIRRRQKRWQKVVKSSK